MSNEVKLLSDDALREIEARANAATDPPWDAQSIEMSLEADKWMRGDNNHNDALFMAHAREDIPALCQTVRALESALRKANEIVEEAARENMKLQLANTALREQLAEAAREINCSGSIAERIRILKQEHHAQLAQVRKAVFRDMRARIEAANPKLTFGSANGSVMKKCILSELYELEAKNG